MIGKNVMLKIQDLRSTSSNIRTDPMQGEVMDGFFPYKPTNQTLGDRTESSLPNLRSNRLKEMEFIGAHEDSGRGTNRWSEW